MTKLLRNASRPAITVQETATVEAAVKTILARRDPAKTPVSAVMTSPVQYVFGSAEDAEAASTMAASHIRHLPILDEKKKVVGMVSLRQVMQERISDLEHEVQVLEAYLGFDGVSG